LDYTTAVPKKFSVIDEEDWIDHEDQANIATDAELTDMFMTYSLSYSNGVERTLVEGTDEYTRL
jgi:hypothetical protein